MTFNINVELAQMFVHQHVQLEPRKCSLQLTIITFGSAISALQSDEWEQGTLPTKPWQMALDLMEEIRGSGLESRLRIVSSCLMHWFVKMHLEFGMVMW